MRKVELSRTFARIRIEEESGPDRARIVVDGRDRSRNLRPGFPLAPSLAARSGSSRRPPRLRLRLRPRLRLRRRLRLRLRPASAAATATTVAVTLCLRHHRHLHKLGR
jgi:hypothetical protein